MPKTSSAAVQRHQRLWLCAMVLPLAGLAYSAAQAQTAKPDTAQAAAAMERAQRIASNPMRIILEAGKMNRKAPADDSAPRASAAVVTVAAAAPAQSAQRLVAAPVASSTAEAEAVAAPAASLSVYDARSRLGGPVASPSPALGQAGAAEAVTTQFGSVDAPVAGPVAGPIAAPVAAPVAASIAAPAAAATATLVAPKLKSMVEPSVPQNVLDAMGSVREVTVKFNIAADGSVSDVALQQPAPRQLARYVQVAVAQWQFEPLPQARAHVVNLVFNAQ